MSRARYERPLLALWLLAVTLFWTATILRSGGLFAGSLSVDYRTFWAATQAFLHDGPAAAYDMPTLNVVIQRLDVFNGPGAPPLQAAPAPYPPPFFVLFAPFAIVFPPLGFVLWTLVNALLAGAAVWPYVRGGRSPLLAFLAALTFFPLAFSLYAGQPSGVLLFGLAQVYWALRAERDFRAGLWLGVLLLKPQYAIGLGLVLLLKRRWRALGGVTVAGTALGALSLALIGIRGVREYRSLLSSVAGFDSAPAGISPRIMIGWRGLLLNLLPAWADADGALLALVLSALTLLSLVIIWRQPWRPKDARFPGQFLGTTIATLLAAYHSHIYGGALLLAPGAALGDQDGGRHRRVVGILALVAPYVLLLTTGSTPLVACALTVLMTWALGATITEARITKRCTADPVPPYPSAVASDEPTRQAALPSARR